MGTVSKSDLNLLLGCKHSIVNFATNASGATCWQNLESMQGGQIIEVLKYSSSSQTAAFWSLSWYSAAFIGHIKSGINQSRSIYFWPFKSCGYKNWQTLIELHSCRHQEHVKNQRLFLGINKNLAKNSVWGKQNKTNRNPVIIFFSTTV